MPGSSSSRSARRKAGLLHGDANATHLQALVWALYRTDGPILELGVGWYSTPLLAGVAEVTGRRVICVEGNRHWFAWAEQRFDGRVMVVSPVDGIHAFELTWGLVLVDHGDGARRAESVHRYRRTCVVVHDTQPNVRQHYPGLEEVLTTFDRRRDFTELEPWTTVVNAP